MQGEIEPKEAEILIGSLEILIFIDQAVDVVQDKGGFFKI